jgi:hypothetical protein
MTPDHGAGGYFGLMNGDPWNEERFRRAAGTSSPGSGYDNQSAMEPTPPATEADLAIGTDVGSYLIEKKIGEGGMGIVYGARHPRIGKLAAIKVLGSQFCRDPSTVERFEQEARLVNEIRHPNIVDIFMFGELGDGRKYIAMEWLDGESLSDKIERGPIPPREAIEIIDGICDALEAVHEKAIIHRDLKSDNVFLVNVRASDSRSSPAMTRVRSRRRRPVSSSERRTTWRPSRHAASPSTTARTSMRSACSRTRS